MPHLSSLLALLTAVIVGSRISFRDSDISSRARAVALPAALEGNWTSTTAHYHADGTRLQERGTINCDWILERTYLQCDRRYTAESGPNRHSIQFYATDATGKLVEVVTLYAGRTTRVMQTVRVLSDSVLSLTGTIRLGDGRMVATHGTMTAESATTVRYRNETEESPGKWRMDYEETYTRRR